MTTYSAAPGPLLDVGTFLGRSLRHSVRSIEAMIVAWCCRC